MTISTTSSSVWLVRHAATRWTGVRWCGRADPPLSPAGRRAAEALARELAAEVPPGAIVVTSPARRARETAASIASELGTPTLILDDLVEVDVGRAEGLTWDELSAHEPHLAATLASGAPVDWPGGESARQLASRAASAATRIAEIELRGPIVVVSHGAFLHALAGVLGGPPDRVPLHPAGVHRIDR